MADLSNESDVSGVPSPQTWFPVKRRRSVLTLWDTLFLGRELRKKLNSSLQLLHLTDEANVSSHAFQSTSPRPSYSEKNRREKKKKGRRKRNTVEGVAGAPIEIPNPQAMPIHLLH